MNAQQLSRRHVMQLAAGALASVGLVRGSLAASGSDTRAKAIIIYFSRTGTTKGLAEAAAAATGADLLELTLKEPYADDYSAMTGIVPEGTSPKKITMIEAHGAKVHVIPGSRDHCADVCRARVREEGIYYANHVVNPFFYEGMKAYIYEVYEELGRIPEHVVLPVGNGTLFIGAVKALEHLLESGAIDHFPKIVALQSEYCDPLLKARELGLDAPVSIDVKPTIAEGIAIGKPLRGSELLEMMKKHDITVVAAPEDKILAARAKIARAGLYIEHTTAANFAAWDHYCELYGPSTDVLITLCGAGIKSDH